MNTNILKDGLCVCFLVVVSNIFLCSPLLRNHQPGFVLQWIQERLISIIACTIGHLFKLESSKGEPSHQIQTNGDPLQ